MKWVTQGARAFDTVDGSSTGAQLAVNAGAVKGVTIQGSRQQRYDRSTALERGASAISESQKTSCSQRVIREMQQAKGVPAAL
jgi:hypothetical protein